MWNAVTTPCNIAAVTQNNQQRWARDSYLTHAWLSADVSLSSPSLSLSAVVVVFGEERSRLRGDPAGSRVSVQNQGTESGHWHCTRVSVWCLSKSKEEETCLWPDVLINWNIDSVECQRCKKSISQTTESNYSWHLTKSNETKSIMFLHLLQQTGLMILCLIHHTISRWWIN